MAYDDFTLNRVRRDFSLEYHERSDLFGRVREIAVPPLLRSTLDDNVRMAVDVNTDKMRGEFITAPILVEVRRLAGYRISLFSGIELDVSEADGLTGVWDFILSLSPSQLIFSAPAMVIAEARNENLVASLGRCAAQMVAARMFNERAGEGPTTIYGAVTSGIAWRFLKLESNRLEIELKEHYIDPVGKILAILMHCVGVEPATVGASADERYSSR
jgi:hypothetical protein